MPPIQAIIFDNDGILVDSEPIWDASRLEMAAERNKEWNKDDHRAVMGTSTAEWTDYMIQRMDLDMSPDEVIAEMVEKMAASYNRQIPWKPGATAAVAYAASHFTTAVASGSQADLLKIVTSDDAIRDYLQVVVSSDEPEVARGKPNPDVYLECAKRLGIAPENCLCIEDSANGIRAGHAAGMIVVAVPEEEFMPPPDVMALAHHTLETLEDFPALLDRLRG
jgi:beta-phosphoglucomutase-like phosphatase (HAD superfamily)